MFPPSSVKNGIIVAVLGVVPALAQTPLGTAFTYQGQLKDGGSPANGGHDLQFRLFDHETLGNLVAGPVCSDGVAVADGLFTVAVDFGAGAFDGDARWLEIGVRADATAGNCDVGPYTTLGPRQAMTAAPYAHFALASRGLSLPYSQSANSSLPLLQIRNTTTAGGGEAIRGESNSSSGIGVRGLVNASTGVTYGVYGVSSSDLGRAVYGVSTSPTGLTYGVFGASSSTGGTGVLGWAPAASGFTVGVRGLAESTNGRGVYGEANETSGTTYGVYGRVHSTSGRGVYGEAAATSGFTYGVSGSVASPQGFAGYFVGGRNYFQGNVGIGVQDPQARLHIGGAAGTDGIQFPDGTLQTTAAASLWQQQIGGNSIYYNAGNVGLGIANPQTRLHIGGNPGTDGIMFPDGTRMTTAYWRGATGGIFYDGGNVSIGGTSSFNRLEVRSSLNTSDGVLIWNVNSGSSAAARLSISTNGGGDAYAQFHAAAPSDFAIGIDQSDNNSFKISQGASLGSNDALTITTARNVGIGTSSPTSPLHVIGSGERVVVASTDSTVDGAVAQHGIATGATGFVYGVWGLSYNSPDGTGVLGYNAADSGPARGVWGITESPSGYGVRGEGPQTGVCGQSTGLTGFGVRGEAQGPAGIGVLGIGGTPGSFGIAIPAGVNGVSPVFGVYGTPFDDQSGVVYGVFGDDGANNPNAYAGYFSGRVHVSGNLSKGGGSFTIDHPLDPANKYLSHSFVESPDMMNVYNGNAVLDAAGEAWVELPAYFETLNRDFRYQLTAIGGPGPNLHIAGKIAGNRFRIAGGPPGREVSWQVTGIRQDAWANANRIVVEQAKRPDECGKYLNPELYGFTPEAAIHGHAMQCSDE